MRKKSLTLSVLGKIFSRRHFEIFFLFSKKTGFKVSCNGDNLHVMSKPVFWENKKDIINMSSSEFGQRVVKV